MAKTLTNARTTTSGGLSPKRSYYPMGANVIILKGSKVALDAAGSAFQLGDPNFVAAKIVGAAESTVDNTTPVAGQAKNASGNSGLKGGALIGVEHGILGWDNDTGAGAIAAKNIGEVSYAKNDKTSSLVNAAGALPEGIVVAVGDNQGGGDGKVYVLMGPDLQALAAAYAASGEGAGAAEEPARAVITSIAAYTAAAGVITANAAGALGAQDGVTLVAGDIVLLAGDKAAAPSDAGPYVVTDPGGATKFVLSRPSWWATGSIIPLGRVVEVGPEGTLFGGSEWKTFSTKGKVVDTDDPTMFPRSVRATITLVLGTHTLGATEGLFLRSTTKSAVEITRNTANTSALTIEYSAPVASRTAGVGGTGAIIVNAEKGDGTLNNADISTLDVQVTNW